MPLLKCLPLFFFALTRQIVARNIRPWKVDHKSFIDFFFSVFFFLLPCNSKNTTKYIDRVVKFSFFVSFKFCIIIHGQDETQFTCCHQQCQTRQKTDRSFRLLFCSPIIHLIRNSHHIRIHHSRVIYWLLCVRFTFCQYSFYYLAAKLRNNRLKINFQQQKLRHSSRTWRDLLSTVQRSHQ